MHCNTMQHAKRQSYINIFILRNYTKISNIEKKLQYVFPLTFRWFPKGKTKIHYTVSNLWEKKKLSTHPNSGAV